MGNIPDVKKEDGKLSSLSVTEMDLGGGKEIACYWFTAGAQWGGKRKRNRTNF